LWRSAPSFTIDAAKIADLNFPVRRASAPLDNLSNQTMGAVLNKVELVDAVSESSGLSKSDAAKAVEAVFDSIVAELRKGEEVRLVGFGSFLVTNRAASEGRNPRTGEPVQIPASKQPKFRAGKGLKEAVNK
jgi:DNA-binding protein HU-beta